MDKLFYQDRRLLTLTIGLIVVAGLSSYYVLPRMEDPELTPRAAIINTPFPGADAERVEALVTEKLEESLRDVPEIKTMRSRSFAGISTMSLELRDDLYDTDVVWSKIRDKINDTSSELPATAAAPIFAEVDLRAFAALVSLTWSAPTEPNHAILRRLAEELRDRLVEVTGTEKVRIFGDPVEEVTVTVRAEQLAALGLTVADVSAQVLASDSKVSAGRVHTKATELLLEVEGEFDSLQRIAETPIRYGPAGQFVPLGDLAEVHKAIRDPRRSLAIIEGRTGVALGAFVRSDYRIDTWAKGLHAQLSTFESRLPDGVQLDLIFDQNNYVQVRLGSLLANLIVGGIGVVGVVLFMMGWRNAIIVGISLPLSALMVISGIRILGIPIHQMSVTGLILALGLLIDNAIVIVDEVSVRMREGASPADAVGQAVRHLSVPLFGSTLTTALAFGPIALMPGPAGEFVGSVAVSVILAVFSSLLLAMTVIPALSALSHHFSAEAETASWWRDGFSLEWLSGWYRRSLVFVYSHAKWGIVVGALLPLLGILQASKLPEQFFPPADRDQVQIELELAASASLQETARLAEQIRVALKKNPRVTAVHWFVGQSAPTFYYNVIRRREGNSQYAQAMVQLDSARNVSPLIHQLQATLDKEFPQAQVLVRQLEQGPPFDAPIEIEIYGPDIEKLRELGEEIRSILAVTKNVIHSQTDLSQPLPKLQFRPDEEELRLAGLSRSAVANQLDANLEGKIGGSILEGTEELPVRIRVDDEGRSDFAQVASLDLLPAGIASRVTNQNSYRGIPLNALGTFRLGDEISGIPHLNARRMNEVKAYLKAGVLPATSLADFQAQLAAKDFQLPPGYSIEYGGETAKRNESVGNLMANVGVLSMMMVATLVLSMRSFLIAGIVGSVAACSIGLGTGALWLFGYPFGFTAIIGTMGLVGVAINDAIVVLAALSESAAARRRDIQAVADIVLRGSRHVLATSATTVAGFAPLVLGGGGFWPPLAISIAAGVAGATLLALYFVPSAFLLLISKTESVANPPASDATGARIGARDPAATRSNALLVPDNALVEG